MIEINDNIPFLWRLSAQENGEGLCVVSMVVPFNTGDESLEHTIETDVLSLYSDCEGQDEEILEWNEDDINLFLKLIANKPSGQPLKPGGSIRVDLTDPDTIEIVHIVAAAGFGLAQTGDNVLIASMDHSQVSFNFEIGSQISLNTITGYKRGVVVDMEEDDVVCVMLESVQDNITLDEEILPHDLLLVKRHQILDPLYTRLKPEQTDVLH